MNVSLAKGSHETMCWLCYTFGIDMAFNSKSVMFVLEMVLP